MKKNLMRIAALLGMLLLLTLVSCDALSSVTGQSKEQCLSSYIRNANNENWTDMYKQFHPDNNNYEVYKNGTAFQGAYLNESPITYEVQESTDSSLTVLVSYAISGDRTETFRFRKDGDDWRILSCTSPGGTL